MNRSVYREMLNLALSMLIYLHAAIRMVDAVSISRLPYASGSVHQPGGRPPSHALPGSTRTDEVRNRRPLCELATLPMLFDPSEESCNYVKGGCFFCSSL